jgi:hypothetical protein
LLNPLLMYSRNMVVRHLSADEHDFGVYYPINRDNPDNESADWGRADGTENLGITRDNNLNAWSVGGWNPNQGALENFWSAQVPTPAATVEWSPSLYPLSQGGIIFTLHDLVPYLVDLSDEMPYNATNCPIIGDTDSDGRDEVSAECNY